MTSRLLSKICKQRHGVIFPPPEGFIGVWVQRSSSLQSELIYTLSEYGKVKGDTTQIGENQAGSVTHFEKRIFNGNFEKRIFNGIFLNFAREDF